MKYRLLLKSLHCSSQSIVLLTVDANFKVSLEWTLTPTVRYFSICSLGDDRFAVTTNDDRLPPVRIIDTQGNEGDFQLIKFPKLIHKINVPYCAYNPVSKTLVWTDKDIIHIVNTMSGMTTTMTDTWIQGTSGVAVEPNGYVYVLSSDTNRVVCIFPHGKVIAWFDDGWEPWFIRLSVSDDGKTLILAAKREIQVYTVIYKDA